jgi:oxalate---CoA ligase
MSGKGEPRDHRVRRRVDRVHQRRRHRLPPTSDESINLSPSRLRSQTIAEAIAQHAMRNPNWPAIVGTQFAPFSFRELDLWITQIREQLRAAGIGPHSRIGVILPPGPESAILGIAIASHAISVPLNSNRPESEIEEELARVCLDALVLPSWVESSAFAIAQRSSFGLLEASRAAGSLSSVTLRQTRETPELTQRPVDPALDSIALIFTTSGTTGTAKLVPVTHENLLVTADKMRQWFALRSDDRTAFVLPGYYGAAIKISLLAPLLLGGSVALPTARHMQDLAEWIPDLCPTWLWGNPTFFQAVLDKLRSRAGMKLTHSLRFVVSGTAHLPPTLREELEATLGVPVLQSYGMSEAGILAADPAPPLKRKPGTVGLISRDELTIVGPKGDLLPDGEVGEIVVHGPTVSPHIGAEVEAKPSKDRWLYTGDLGSIDSYGYLTVVGRTKELINRGGEKISPYEVEKALLLHPSVKEAAAFSVPHPRLGENVAAAVVLKPESNPPTPDIKTFLADHLAPFKIPQHVLVMPQLPKGATGKISRSELSEAMVHRTRTVAPPYSPLEFQIRDIWQTLLHRDDVGIDDDFFELGGDSLLALQMILELEAIARRKISPSILKAVYTIRQLVAAIVGTDSSTSEELVTCAKQGDGAPFFLCHGDFVTLGLWAFRLVEMLRCNRPVFLVWPHPDPKLSIEEMAKSYLPHLLAAQRTGAFCLGGFCNGGVLAWELAHQLESLGREIECVVLIDTRSFNARLPFRMIGRLAKLIAAVTPGKIRENFNFDAMHAIWVRVKRPVYYGPYFRALSNYVPPKLQCEVVAVLSDESRGMNVLSAAPWRRLARKIGGYEFFTIPWRRLARKIHRRYEYSTAPWSRLARKVHPRYLAGTHVGAVTTCAGELALLLDGILCEGPTFDRTP